MKYEVEIPIRTHVTVSIEAGTPDEAIERIEDLIEKAPRGRTMKENAENQFAALGALITTYDTTPYRESSAFWEVTVGGKVVREPYNRR